MKPKDMMKDALKLYGGATIVGAMPTMGNANVASIQGNVTGGMAKYSEAYPTMGSLMGTGMVIGQAKRLIPRIPRGRKHRR